MWSNNDMDSTAAGAGGFFNTTAQGDGAAAEKKTVRRHQSVTPIVVRQVRDHPGEEFTLFGMPTQILYIVGILRDVEVQSTKATYTIEDHTGTIKAIWWLENDSDKAPSLPAVKEGAYVQVFGTLRKQDQERVIMVLRMFPIDNADIITNHLLQVIQVRLEAEAASKRSKQIKPNNPGTALANTMSFMNENVPENGQGVLTPMQDKVMALLKACSNVTGVNRSDIMSKFPPMQHRNVNDALEFLINEGHAYTTIDHDHFKNTDVY